MVLVTVIDNEVAVRKRPSVCSLLIRTSRHPPEPMSGTTSCLLVKTDDQGARPPTISMPARPPDDLRLDYTAAHK
jgi:hypothetical protein